MSVEPGFGGQAFQPQTLEKVRLLRSEIEARGLHTRIEIDGGINAQSGALAVEAGCDTLVAGSTAPRHPPRHNQRLPAAAPER